MTRTWPSWSTITLSGLKSRWTSRAACAAARPRPGRDEDVAGPRASERRAAFSQYATVWPSTNSIAMKTWSSKRADVVDHDDVRVREPRDRLRLAQQARLLLDVLGPARAATRSSLTAILRSSSGSYAA